MEERQSVPPEIVELHAKSMRVEGIIEKKQTIAATIASSRVRRVIEHRSLPALKKIYRSLQEEIADRQQLLSDAEYTLNLQELGGLEGNGVLTNQSVIGMVEEALRKINQELHSQPNLAAQRALGEASEHPAFSPAPNSEAVSPGNERILRAPEAIESQKLLVLKQLADGYPLPQLMEELNKENVHPFTVERAERLLHGIFTKLYGRVTRNEADDEELKAWQDISGRVPSLEPKQIRDDFRDYMSKYFHPRSSSAQPRPERRTREPHEKKPIDPSVLIHQVLERISNHGIKVGTNQRFNPLQVVEIFGANRTRDKLALEKGIVTPEKRRGNDYHPSYNFLEAIQMTVISKWRGATREQLEEELPILIELEVEKWAKEHPAINVAK